MIVTSNHKTRLPYIFVTLTSNKLRDQQQRHESLNGNSKHDNEVSDEDQMDSEDDEEESDQNNGQIHCCDNIDSVCEPSDEDQLDSDDEETNRMRQRINNDPGIQSLMEISLPSPIPMVNVHDDCKFHL